MNRQILEEHLNQRWNSDPEFQKRVKEDGGAVLREFYPQAPTYLSLEVTGDGLKITAPGPPVLQPKPAFFDPDDFPFLKILRDRFQALREEAVRVTGEMERLDWVYPNYFREDSLLAQGSRARFMLWFVGMRLKVNMDRCPVTSELCWSIPGLVSAGFYLLGPRTKMLNHVGTRSDILRGHFGMIVPGDCALKVGTEERAWEEGEFLIFDDTHPHEAWNNSDSYRCVFHFDFYRNLMPDIQRAASTRSLRAKLLESGPGYFPWLLAAGAQTDGDQVKQIKEGVDPEGDPFRVASTLARDHGVFL